MPQVRKLTADEVADFEASPPSRPGVQRYPLVPRITLDEAKAMLAALPDARGIARLHYKRCNNSWLARVYRKPARAWSKSFADRTYGSAAASLAAAVAWRDEMRQQPGEVLPPARG